MWARREMLLIERKVRGAARYGMMNETRDAAGGRLAHGPAGSETRGRRWHWQAMVAALIALVAVEGQPVAASHATAGQAGRLAEFSRRQAAAPARVEASASVAQGTDVAVRDGATDARPDFGVTFTALDEAQAGRPFSYTLQVRNDGTVAGVASVSAVVPPELSNVRVSAPGFVCTRRFAASGAQAGTLVTCMRNDLEGGAVADVTIEANAPSAAGSYQLTAVADPRDEVAEADEGNNAADATVQVRG